VPPSRWQPLPISVCFFRKVGVFYQYSGGGIGCASCNSRAFYDYPTHQIASFS
jgi:lipoprotein